MIIQQTNWINRARRAAGAKGPAQVDLLEDVNQMVTVADLSSYEYDWLGQVKRFQTSISIAALAANLSIAQIVNPTGSGELVLVDRVEYGYSGGAGVLTNVEKGGLAANALALAAFLPLPADFRWGLSLTGQTTIQVSAGNNPTSPVGASILTRSYGLGAGDFRVLDRGYVIPPGFLLEFEGGVLNQQLSVNVYFRVRPAESGELAAG